jgi:hypothetical protein
VTASRGSWILPATITLREVTLGYATKAGWSPCAASSLLTHGRRFGHTVLSLRTRICLVQPGELWLLVSAEGLDLTLVKCPAAFRRTPGTLAPGVRMD